jgi:hypothetical protein
MKIARMHLKSRIPATLAGVALLAGTVVVPALAQQQVTPTSASEQATPTASQDTSTTSVTAEAQRELSASEAEIQKLVNEGTVKSATLTQADLENLKKLAASTNYYEKAVGTAGLQYGYKEGPKNNNKFSQYFGKNHQPWCADFVSWAFDSTGNKDKKVPWGNPSAVVNILEWGQKEKYLVKTPKLGDIFIMTKNGVSHTGLVWEVAKDGKSFRTVEGNSSDKVNSNWRSVSTYPYQFLHIPSNRFPL